jgi:hypothetical protein
VLIQWAWNYFTRRRGARLITGRESGIFSEERKHKEHEEGTEKHKEIYSQVQGTSEVPCT